MTKKDYEVIADSFILSIKHIEKKTTVEDKNYAYLIADNTVDIIIGHLKKALVKNNPKFDSKTFDLYIKNGLTS